MFWREKQENTPPPRATLSLREEGMRGRKRGHRPWDDPSEGSEGWWLEGH